MTRDTSFRSHKAPLDPPSTVHRTISSQMAQPEIREILVFLLFLEPSLYFKKHTAFKNKQTNKKQQQKPPNLD